MSGGADRPTYEQLEAENAALKRRIAEQDRRIAALEEQVRRLLERIAEAERAGKRQAAPFSKGEPKADPKPPGRKPGEGYGAHARGAVPDESAVRETVEVPLPAACPCCGGRVAETSVDDQYQTDIPKVETFVRRFRIHVGECTGCGKRVQPRHPLQTSDALHAAGVGFGPELVALAVHLNKHGGLSWEKTAAFFAAAFGIAVARATLCRAMLRLAAKLRPTYELLKAALPSQPVVHPDETGWREGGRPRWLWAFVTPQFTVYRIADSRGSDVILAMLTAEFAGLLGRDGWAPYLCLEHAVMQTCLAHFLRRCNEILEFAEGRAAEYPRAVKALVGDALDLRDRKDEMPEAEFAQRRTALEERVEDLAARSPTWEPNRKLAGHLSNERAFVLTFLYFAAVEATNWPGEHAMRFAVGLRKVCGGNRTPAGSRAQETLISILRTCRQQGRDAVAIFVAAQHSREPLALDLTGPPPVPFDQIPHRVFTRTAGPARRCAGR